MRITRLIVSMVLAGPLVASAQHLRLQDTFIPPGKAGNVKVVLEEAAGLGSLDLLIRYDPAVLRFETVADGTTGESMEVVGHAARAGELKIAMMTANRLAGRGSPFEIRFTALAAQGSTSELTIVRGQAFSGETQLMMPMQFAGGRVIVGSPAVVPPLPDPPPALSPVQPTLPLPPDYSPPLMDVGPEAGWQLDTDLLLNLAIATTAGLLLVVLVIGLYYAVRSGSRPAEQPGEIIASDDGPIPLEPGPAADAEAGPRVEHDPSSAQLNAGHAPADVVCDGCRAEVSANARFCPQCGRKLG